MTEPLPELWRAAGALPIALAAFLLGRAALSKPLFATALESSVLRVTVGLVLLALLGFALGLFELLSPVPALGTLTALSLSAIWLRRDPRSALSHREAFGPTGWLFWGLLAAFGIALARFALFPPSEGDDVAYHLPVARDFVEHGLRVASPYLRFAVGPQAADLLLAWGLLAGGSTAAQLVSLLAWLLTTLLIFVWGARDDAPRAGLWAAALWIGGQTALNVATRAYVDGILTLFVAAAAYALWRWRSAPGAASRAALFWTAAGVAGAAAATKYTGLWVVLLLAAGAASWARPGSRTRTALLFLLGAFAVALPWYLRNALLAGDPLFPGLGPWLGSGLWSAEDLAGQRAELLSHGVGRDAWSLVSIWWDLAFRQSRFHAERVVSLALVLPLPVLAFLRRRSARGRAIALFSLGFILPWFFTGQVLRYLLPILPLLCLEVAALLESLARRVRLRERSVLGAAVASALALALAWPGIEHLAADGRRRGPLPATMAARSRYLAERIPGYEAVAELNGSRGREYGLYALHGVRLAYACEGRFYGDWFGPARYAEVTARLDSPEELADWLTGLGATHLLVVRLHPDEFLPSYPGAALPAGRAFEARFQPLLGWPDFTLYRILPGPGRLDAPRAEPR